MKETKAGGKGIFKTNAEFEEWVLTHTDQTTLEPTLTSSQLCDFIMENGKAGFKHVCIPLTQLKTSREVIGSVLSMLQGWDDMKVATVIGFPHGNESTSEDKVRQIEYAWRYGADEVDFVINISLLRTDTDGFRDEVRQIVSTAHSHSMRCKAIFETYYLSDDEITRVASICEGCGVDFVKTSTGFATKGKNHKDRDAERIGAEEDAILLMGKGVKDKTKVGIKPAGGIRTKEQLLSILAACIEAGWDKDMVRTGSSAGRQIIEEIGTCYMPGPRV